MEEFSSIAQKICFSSSFPQSPAGFTCYTLTEKSLVESWEPDLAAFFSSVDQAPTLRLGIIPTDEHRRPCLDNVSALNIWKPEVAGFDGAALWLFHHKYDGYHHFLGDGETETFFYGSSRQAITWTYNRRTLATKAMIVERLPNKSRRLPDAETSQGMQSIVDSLLLLVLKEHSRHISAPNFMGYTFAVSACLFYDSYDNQYELDQIRKIEATTGFQWLGTPLREGLNMVQITKWLQTTGQVLIAYSGRKRSLEAIELLLDHLTSQLDDEYLTHGETALRKRSMDSRRHLSEAIPHLRRRIRAYGNYMDYMTFRVERLSSVLSTLLTHSDAQTSIQHAEASRDLAEAAKQGSSAMKTIATMTLIHFMCFLPKLRLLWSLTQSGMHPRFPRPPPHLMRGVHCTW